MSAKAPRGWRLPDCAPLDQAAMRSGLTADQRAWLLSHANRQPLRALFLAATQESAQHITAEVASKELPVNAR